VERLVVIVDRATQQPLTGDGRDHRAPHKGTQRGGEMERAKRRLGDMIDFYGRAEQKFGGEARREALQRAVTEGDAAAPCRLHARDGAPVS
jgi:hypothetical protein